MTAADPHGDVRDWLRHCYAAWMMVPEFEQPIRVRWYRVPEPPPGDIPETLYTSSDWDELKDYDPPLGEQGSLRRGFEDNRDCDGPPWDCPRIDDCGVALGPQHTGYQFRTTGFVMLDGYVDLNGAFEVDHTDECVWDNYGEFGDRPPPHWVMEFQGDGGAQLIAVSNLEGDDVQAAVYLAAPPVDPAGPIRFKFFEQVEGLAAWPEVITLTGMDCNDLVSSGWTDLCTEDGDTLST